MSSSRVFITNGPYRATGSPEIRSRLAARGTVGQHHGIAVAREKGSLPLTDGTGTRAWIHLSFNHVRERIPAPRNFLNGFAARLEREMEVGDRRMGLSAVPAERFTRDDTNLHTTHLV